MDDDDAIHETHQRPRPGEAPKPFRPSLVPETGGALHGLGGEETKIPGAGQIKSQDNPEVWFSSSGRVAVQQTEKVMSQPVSNKKINGALEMLKLVGWVIFFGLLVSACAISVVAPYRGFMGWMGW